MENEVGFENEKRVNLGFKVKPSLRAGLAAQAKREKRSLGNLSEVLLEWAYQQLQRSGHTIDLMENWEISPINHAQIERVQKTSTVTLPSTEVSSTPVPQAYVDALSAKVKLVAKEQLKTEGKVYDRAARQKKKLKSTADV